MCKSWNTHCSLFCVMFFPVETGLCRIISPRAFFEDNGVHWGKTPPESPDANPIENLWHELKEYIRREVKPHNNDELVKGIIDFWKTVDKDKCIKYIRVTPKIIELEGAATGY